MKSQIAIAGMFINGSLVLLSLLFGGIAAGVENRPSLEGPPEALGGARK